MKRKVFKTILFVAACTLIITLLLTTVTLYSHFMEVEDRYLDNELEIAVEGVESNGTDFLEHLSSATYRITWISKDGEIIFDTHSNKEEMDNHADREEIEQALKTGYGSSVRYSSTMTEKTIYEAVLLSDGSVLRASVRRDTVWELFFGMLPHLLFVAVFTAALSYLVGKRMAQRVVDPLNQLDLDAPMANKAYDEIMPLLRRIESQHLEITKQMADLEKQKDEFEQITSSIRECLVLLDNEGRILGINNAARKLFGLGEDSIGDIFVGSSDMHEVGTHIERAKDSGHDTFRREYDGRTYQLEISRIESEGKAVGVVILAFDITDKVQAEILRQDFAANVSHELKTPLQGIIGSAELIENGMIGASDVPRFVGHIRTEAARLVILIEDIIRLSHLDDGVELPKEIISLKALANEVGDMLSDVAAKKGVAISVEGTEGEIYGIPSLMYEIIYNLCDNAIKYNSSGGSVKIAVNTENDRVYLAVSDSGIGIAEDEQEKIFERFYRVDKSRSKQSGGTGLGLSIVKHAVACHEGRLEIESTEGLGTTIKIGFPTKSDK